MRWKNSRNSPFLAENRNTWSVNSTDGGGGLCTRAIHSLLQCGGTSKNSWPRFPFRRTNHHNVFSLFIFRIVQSILGSFSSRYTHVEVSGSRRNMWKKKKKKHERNIREKTTVLRLEWYPDCTRYTRFFLVIIIRERWYFSTWKERQRGDRSSFRTKYNRIRYIKKTRMRLGNNNI